MTTVNHLRLVKTRVFSKLLELDKLRCGQRVLNTHSSDQIVHLFADLWPATARAGFPSPIRGEAHSVPTHNSLGPDDGYRLKNARTATIEPNEQGAVGPTQMQSAWCTLLQDIELMPLPGFRFPRDNALQTTSNLTPCASGSVRP